MEKNASGSRKAPFPFAFRSFPSKRSTFPCSPLKKIGDFFTGCIALGMSGIHADSETFLGKTHRNPSYFGRFGFVRIMMDFCGFFQRKSSEFGWIPEIPKAMCPVKKSRPPKEKGEFSTEDYGVLGPRDPLFQETGIRAPVWGGGNPKSCRYLVLGAQPSLCNELGPF